MHLDHEEPRATQRVMEIAQALFVAGTLRLALADSDVRPGHVLQRRRDLTSDPNQGTALDLARRLDLQPDCGSDQSKDSDLHEEPAECHPA